jgi:uncharacterized protein YbbC (DUF1343 family)
MSVLPGIDVLLTDHLDLLRGRRVGLVSSASGLTWDLRSTAAALQAVTEMALVALFGPEHGFYGAEADGRSVPSTSDTATNLPIYSLYGDHKRPSTAMLEGIDLLIYDIQTVGVRFYTYTTTLLYLLQAAAAHAIPVIVCDRPNPIGGHIVEGPIMEPPFESFIGCGALPIRHGLTIGELARLYHTIWDTRCQLTVIPCRGWQRHMWYDETGLLWVPPSPGMPKLETAVCYPGTCLIEGTNLSEGRGTAVPFEQIGAPWLNGRWLAQTLNSQHHPGVIFRPTHFQPTDSKWCGQLCHGVQLHVTDRNVFRPVTATLALLMAVQAHHPDQFSWRLPHFDRLMGTDRVRQQVEEKEPVSEIIGRWATGQRAFDTHRRSVMLYH